MPVITGRGLRCMQGKGMRDIAAEWASKKEELMSRTTDERAWGRA